LGVSAVTDSPKRIYKTPLAAMRIKEGKKDKE
jgi:hypothetical protein